MNTFAEFRERMEAVTHALDDIHKHMLIEDACLRVAHLPDKELDEVATAINAPWRSHERIVAYRYRERLQEYLRDL